MLDELHELLTIKTNDDVERLRQIYTIIDILHQFVYNELSSISVRIKSRQHTNTQIADMGYFLREIETLLNETRKDVSAHLILLSKLLAYQITLNSINDTSVETIVRGKYARATADVKMRPILPKKGTLEYKAVLSLFNVPEDAVESGVLKLDWNTTSDLLTNLISEGRPLPKGLTETFPDYRCTFTKIKESNNGKEN